ncbi:hypothetical protein J5N97_029265 [Dioscorea zingiberensis]|uniref:NAC domain-containing protein n=1 Tax=Dioscorea zingiberensis TaxID=325984 RepID=A0A9D5H5N3_9LILI|nr:hypothetical protein J5N97_029265 [Dioscorea zingiberensis]
MSISVNGQSRVPPGFRFHPTEEELLNYYLTKKVACEKIDLDVIRDVDLNKLEPWDIQEKCRIGSTPQNDWYFFSHKDKKYPTGTRTNRATAAGFWKATGRDKVICTSFKRIGMRKTLVFYKGRAPHGQKSDWIMHEYRLDDHCSDNNTTSSNVSCTVGEGGAQEDGWVVCRVFKKKNHHKALDSPNTSSSINNSEVVKTQVVHSSSDGALDQILQYMGRSCKQENENFNTNNNTHSSTNNNAWRYLLPIDTALGSTLHERFMKLPALESPITAEYPDNSSGSQTSYPPDGLQAVVNMCSGEFQTDQGLNDWAALDRLVASHLNGSESEASKHDLSCFDDTGYDYQSGGDGDLWSFRHGSH